MDGNRPWNRCRSGVFSTLALVIVLSPSGSFAQPELPAADARLTARLERAFQRESPNQVRRLIERAFLREQSPLLLQASERMLRTFGRVEDAEFLREQLPLPSAPEEARVLARAHLLQGDIDAADALMVRWARRQDRPAAALLRELASARVERGELAAAQRSLELARRVLPQDRALLLELASLHLARGLPAFAVALLQNRLQLVTHDDEARRRLAFAFHAAGRSDDAIRELIRLGGPGDLCSASRVALEHGQVPRAVALARRGVTTSGPDEEAVAQRTLGFALARTGDRAAAVRALRRALVLDPSSVEARTRLGELTDTESGS